ncbi:MAG: exo-beta-N-acetylmuramidase NamZ domain-containing protein [Candidatus Babeliales bacterium]
MKKQLLSFIKIIFIICLVIFLPKFLGNNNIVKQTAKQKSYLQPQIGIQNLINNITEDFSWIKKLNLAFVYNKSDSMKTLLANNIRPANSYLINKKKDLSKIIEQNFAYIDAILFDMTSYGLRNDLSFNCLEKLIKIAAQKNKKLIILDRPNPLGRCVEGPGFIPLKPGLTLGEMALYLNKYSVIKSADLFVVPIVKWQADKFFVNNEDLLSTKFNNLNALQSYSFLKFLKQIKPINVGKYSDYKYQILGLPNQQELSEWETDYLKKIFFKFGILCENYNWIDKKTNTKFNGIKIKIKKNIDSIFSFNTFLNTLRFLKNRKNIKLFYSKKLNNLIGSDVLKAFLQNFITFDQLKIKIDKDLYSFYKKAEHCFLYRPLPVIKKVELIKF